MKIDLMARPMTWDGTATAAQELEALGFSGMLFTEAVQVPWMSIAAAARATTTLELSTGIAVAFPRSPMISAQVAWELARETRGRFRLGIGSQVKGHVTRRYSSLFDKPAAQMRDYVQAFRACIAAFRREAKLHHEGPYYPMNLLPREFAPARHDHEDIKLDISAVGPLMCRLAGELADGLHVHPMHSLHYIHNRLLPAVAKGAELAGRDAAEIDLIVPAFAVAGDSPEERAPMLERARMQVAFYGSTPNYDFQFDDLGYTGTTQTLNELMRKGDSAAMAAQISDEMLEHFVVVGRWDDIADQLIERYRGIASRLAMYLTAEAMHRNPATAPKWGEVARAVLKAP